MEHLELPEKLEEFRNTIESSELECIRINTTETSPGILESKFFGTPFLPKGTEYPKSRMEEPMIFLGQLNLSELPDNNLLPRKGILQFYVAHDDSYGLDFGDKINSDFRILFFDDAENMEYREDFDFLEEIDWESPIDREYGLEFAKDRDFVPSYDRRFEDYFGMDILQLLQGKEDDRDKLHELYLKTINGSGHKLGGYGFFVQEDPRKYLEACKDYVLLLQIDTEGDIMWGDSGSAQFLIDKNDLARLDFSKALYNWSCY